LKSFYTSKHIFQAIKLSLEGKIMNPSTFYNAVKGGKKTSTKLKSQSSSSYGTKSKVKHYINATKSKNIIKALQVVFTSTAETVSITQMVYDPNKFNSTLSTNNNCNVNQEKNLETDANCIKPFQEYFKSLVTKAYFTHNQRIKPDPNLFYSRNIKAIEQMMNESRYPTVAQSFINRETRKAAIPK
jgi:hypothetical protein